MTRRVSKEFRIPFIGLKPGKYQYDYTLGDKFFEAFDYSEINKSNIVATVDLEKQSNLMLLHFTLDGSVMVSCDRCGDPIEQSIHLEEQLVVKFGERTLGDDGEFLVLGPNEGEIDLTQYLYEYAHLALPARHVHAEISSCNQDVMNQLQKHEVSEDDVSKWAALKNLTIEERNFPDDDLDEEE
jgi:uncharacterized metal-binding protein YceD (DUF177 family)